MNEHLIQHSTLTSLADGFREKNNITTQLTPSQMITLLNDMDNINTSVQLIDASIENITNSRVTSIGKYSLYQRENLANVNLPAVRIIEDYGFYKCTNLQNCNTPLCETIGAFAFRECSSLVIANFQNATIVEQGAFDGCSMLSSVNFPLITIVEPLTFRKCENLTTIDLANVSNIGTQAFYNSGISSLILRSNTVVSLENKDAFYFTPIEEGTGYIYVPSELVANYKATSEWSVYANQIRAIE